MNQDNKFGEIKEKLLQYWAVFLSACGQFWDIVKEKTGAAWVWLKRNGRILLQKLAAWLLKAREWLGKTTAALRVRGKAAWENFSVWFAGVLEKLRPIPGQVKTWWADTAARLKSGKPAETAEALPAAQAPKALPGAAEAPVAEVPAPVEETPVTGETAAAEPAAETGNPYLRKALAVLAAIGKGIRFVIRWLWKLRKLFMAAPVVWAAVKFAMENMERLPEKVGLDIQSTGEFARMITREEAVYWPLGITAFCLLLMFCAKKPILPWVISIFTLILPWLIWILNYYA